MTQAEMARALRVSIRAVQSYEQGWRTLPVPLAVQLLTLLAVYKGNAESLTPCWKQTGCPADARSKCPSFRVTGGRYCWLVAGDTCGGRVRAAPAAPLRCLSCPVTVRLMAP
jgi:hypothetical protein